VDAAIRRGQAAGGADAADGERLDILPALERLGRELEALIAGAPAGGGEEAAAEPAVAASTGPAARPEERRAELDRLLRVELETQGIVVTGREVARVVAAATGKGIEWTG
jgi:hypothetical protein